MVVNGVGDGFLKPKSGLRQGCALSPYMFILGMDLLTRHLQFQVDEGVLKGVKIAASAHPIVSCVYADDLLLFGAATEAEALLIKQALAQFSKVSG